MPVPFHHHPLVVPVLSPVFVVLEQLTLVVLVLSPVFVVLEQLTLVSVLPPVLI